MEKANLKCFSISEQQTFSEEDKANIKELNLNFSDKEVRFLGLNPFNYSVSYYIGIDWLKEKESYIAVVPKIKSLDYVKMFVHCLYHPETSKFIKDVYHIDFEKPQIETPNADWDLTPFLIVHFLSLVETITIQGLKSNYIIREENLNSKIKGKILFSQQVKKNVLPKCENRIYCRFQEYSKDCPENRLLKKTLLFLQSYTSKHLDKEKYKVLFQKQYRLLSVFENISEDISYTEIKRIRINALYKEYVEAIDLAKKILRRFGYSYMNTYRKEDKKLPPFWIDMSKLFELYVYSLLKDEIKDYKIEFQKGTKRQIPDFLLIKKDDRMIIDTKYKPTYKDNWIIDDIRQLSGYARTEKILNILNIPIPNETVVDCVIIYPNKTSNDNFKDRELKESSIEGFTKFHKCGIKLPLK